MDRNKKATSHAVAGTDLGNNMSARLSGLTFGYLKTKD